MATRAATQPANSTRSASDFVTLVQQLDAGGSVVGAQSTASTATLSNVASSASSVQLLAANTSRKAVYIFNDSTQVLYVKFGTTASTSSYTVQIAAGGYYEMPTSPTYTGRIDGIWASANGNARITEI